METPQPIRQLRPEVSEELELVIQRAMAAEAAKRCASARELGQALYPFSGPFYHPPPPPPGDNADRSCVTPTPHDYPDQSASHPPSISTPHDPHRRSSLLIGALLLGVLVLLALVTLGGATTYYAMTRASSPQPPQTTRSPQATRSPTPNAEAMGAPGFPLRPHERMVDVSDIHVEGAPALGPDDASVVIYELSDFQCLPCASAHATAVSSWERHRQQVRLVSLHFPIDARCNRIVSVPHHAAACPAAALAFCASEQDRFWEVSQALYRYSSVLDHAHVSHVQREANLDDELLRECLDSERPWQRIAADVEIAVDLGVTATPVHIVNGLMLFGDPGPRLDQVINYLLQRGGSWR